MTEVFAKTGIFNDGGSNFVWIDLVSITAFLGRHMSILQK